MNSSETFIVLRPPATQPIGERFLCMNLKPKYRRNLETSWEIYTRIYYYYGQQLRAYVGNDVRCVTAVGRGITPRELS